MAAAEEIGYPVLIKATGGGGGMGIYKCFTAAEVRSSLPLAISQGQKSFANGDVFVEKFIEKAKHIEVQVRAAACMHVYAGGRNHRSCDHAEHRVLTCRPLRRQATTPPHSLCLSLWHPLPCAAWGTSGCQCHLCTARCHYLAQHGAALRGTLCHGLKGSKQVVGGLTGSVYRWLGTVREW